MIGAVDIALGIVLAAVLLGVAQLLFYGLILVGLAIYEKFSGRRVV